ncbi:CheR family methyltransferase [Azoarcus sp. KH32C]|uniref:CheR family methyltransferase n=1 Tax=Azoarcus sp. KH32C TaxID=748247 RepID=UPI0002385EB0|nr:CheR family methyltransferase [Azoarcus sp. KH32C]BAL23974.1 hypothetical protein AZKH_1659 [Azoarcus sp. KH32C]
MRETPYEDGRPLASTGTSVGSPPVHLFFRDPEFWAALRSALLPRVKAAYAADRPLRTWIANCGRGEEAYAVAILLCELLDEVEACDRPTVRILASDPDLKVIALARRSWFPERIADELSPERLARFFRREDGGFRIRRELRDMIIFAAHDATADAPFSNLDLLVYCTAGSDSHDIPLPLLHYSLLRDGLLAVRGDAGIADAPQLFALVDGPSRIYRRLPGTPQAGTLDFVMRNWRLPRPGHPGATLKTAADAVLLQQFSLPAVVANEAGDILYFNGRTGNYLELPTGQAGWNIHAVAPVGLHHALLNGLAQSIQQRTRIVLPGQEILASGQQRRVQVTIQPLQSEEPPAALIVFRELRSDSKLDDTDGQDDAVKTSMRHELYEFNQENLRLSQQMHDLREQLTLANEELQSFNEELFVTNEDLRSSNDQVQTINEALLQALTNGEEARRRIETLSRRLIAVQEMERRRLSTELHDRTSPNLAAMEIILKSLAPAMPPGLDGSVAHLFDDLTALLQDTTASIREICADLRPPVLDHAGLLPALESYAQQFTERTGVEVSVTSDNSPIRLNAEHQSLLFRIAQEALTNCAKHAEASRVAVELATRYENVVLRIADNGIGFAPDNLVGPGQRRGLGLLTMRERAEFAGGSFSVDSQPGEGTRIAVEIACDFA